MGKIFWYIVLQISEKKTNDDQITYANVCVYMYPCVSGSKKCSLFGKFLETPVLRFALLSYYRRNICEKSTTNILEQGPGTFPANIYLFKVNNSNTKKRGEKCPKFTRKALEESYWHRSSVFIVNFEHISYLFLMPLLLTLSMCLYRQLWIGIYLFGGKLC